MEDIQIKSLFLKIYKPEQSSGRRALFRGFDWNYQYHDNQYKDRSQNKIEIYFDVLFNSVVIQQWVSTAKCHPFNSSLVRKPIMPTELHSSEETKENECSSDVQSDPACTRKEKDKRFVARHNSLIRKPSHHQS